MQAKEPQPTEDEMISTYVDLVQQIPEVQLVVLVKDDPYAGGARLWVVVDAPRLDRNVENRVYDADFDVMRRYAEFPYDFRLINVRELRHPLEEVLPDGDILFTRKQAA